MAKFQDLTGQRFYRLAVVSRAANTHNGNATWHVICDCGAYLTVHASSLKQGNTKSCGCLKREIIGASRKTHGKSNTKLHRLWGSIKKRTQNKNARAYGNYGGRGIAMHPEWADSFEAFEAYILENLGERPEGKSLDRRDNEKGYEPGNLRWATRSEQNRNTRSNIWVEYGGEYYIMADLAGKLGRPRGTLRCQVLAGKFKFKRGLNHEDANSDNARD